MISSLETSWNRSLRLTTPCGHFPLRPGLGHSPLAVQAYVRTLRDEVAQLQNRVETLETRLQQNTHDLIQATVIRFTL